MRTVILLTGRNGQLGYELSRMLPQLGEVTSLDRQKLDLSKPEDIRKAIRAVRPDLIMNAAAFTAVDQAESDEAAARAINSVGPAVMAEEAKKIGAAMVHYSTDFVFDGTKSTPYVEQDPPNPQNVYGKTKLEGERAIQHMGVSHLIFSHGLGLCHTRPQFPADDSAARHAARGIENRAGPNRCAYLEP